MLLDSAKVDGVDHPALPFQDERVAPVAQAAGKAPFDAHHRVDGHLGGPPLVVGTFPGAGLPGHAELGQCFSRRADEVVARRQYGVLAAALTR